MATVGFVGAGQLGQPMVERLLQAGHEVRVHARRPEARARLTAAGATVVDSPRLAASTAAVVLACLFSDDQLRAVCEGPEGVLAGLGESAVLASHVTGPRETLHRFQSEVGARGAAVVDAPVSGTAADIRGGRLTVLLGGAPAAVQQVADVVQAYASPVLPTGELGSALAVKLVNNLLFAAHAQLAVQAVALAGQLGVDGPLLLRTIAACSGNSTAATTLATLPDAARFEELAGPYLRKDVAACVEELEALGVGAGLLADVVRDGPLDLTR